MTRKVTALTKNGAPIVSVFVNEDETLGDLLDIISDELAKNESRRVYLDKWRNEGYIIKCGEEIENDK